MKVTVAVADADRRGVHSVRYRGVLGNLIAESVDSGHATTVTISDSETPVEGELLASILANAKEITDPATRDGLFD